MIRYNPETGIMTMDLVDLEHCGFEHGLFEFELLTSRIDLPDANWPIALLVNFAGGAVVTPATSDAARARMREDQTRFDEIVAAIAAGANHASQTD